METRQSKLKIKKQSSR